MSHCPTRPKKVATILSPKFYVINPQVLPITNSNSPRNYHIPGRIIYCAILFFILIILICLIIYLFA